MIFSMEGSRGEILQPVILDSCVWIAYFAENDTCHVRACKIFDLVEDDIFLIPEQVFAEVCTVLRNKATEQEVSRFVSFVALNESANVVRDSDDVFNIAVEEFITHKKLSFVDALLLTYAEAYFVITFDEELKKHVIDKRGYLNRIP